MSTEKILIDEEIQLDPKRYIVSETDEKGRITFCNDYFIEICGYSKEELIGSPHNIIRHPDMPKVVFKLLWETIKQGKNINAVVKNRAKDGRYYWIFTEFESRRDVDTNEIIGYTASRKTISKHIIEVIANLYSKLLVIEETQGIEESEKYLIEFLREQGEDIEFVNIMEEIHKFY
ncbi:MAG: PAS domain-containing protein [Campylobacteraceae bacterium]|jgi:PAS domain S-box-containing protein|nr:PAS domain-containing protein [Campylobacteraceae bacterium]MBT3883025.1 PAS domain-containing protein [Campylobacteraceae bacterium]MBT4179364.1 PAS domain-containing protein [Campylobacteraceae bacterium]MBT4707649.1 PAS domain-containing protein [Campylobacteraceae bacterium]MBT5323671.1 PAS domain-containing protein [Campylobacteraceae bacterium]